MTMRRPIEILLVEDNAADVLLTVEALREGRILNRVNIVGDGAEALAFLRREGHHATAPRPNLVLLDLHLPKLSGQEVMAAMQADPSLRNLPVIVLTASRSDVDAQRMLDLGVAHYIVKPVEPQSFIEAVRSIRDFWIDIVELPIP